MHTMRLQSSRSEESNISTDGLTGIIEIIATLDSENMGLRYETNYARPYYDPNFRPTLGKLKVTRRMEDDSPIH